MSDSNPLEIIFEDENIVVINKPHGLLVHRSKLARDVKVFAMQLLRDQIGQKVYPSHRLDRKTSGVLVFTKTKDYDRLIQMKFMDREVSKTYVAIVRGYTPPEGTIDYALTENEKTKEALSHFKTIQQFEIPLKHGHFETSRYSQVELKPETGRFHQLRKHMAHIHHPIIGDRPHGCNKQNKLWKEQLNHSDMLLHAQQLSFSLSEKEHYEFKADYSLSFKRAFHILNDYPNI